MTANYSNFILDADSYKYSHYLQYPDGLTQMAAYISARNTDVKYTKFFGLTAYLQKYLARPITACDIDEAEALISAHAPGIKFNRDGWEHIVREHNGFLPVEIYAAKEGTCIPPDNVLVSIHSTDPAVPWIVPHLETSLLRGIWAGTTAATRSALIKEVLVSYLEKTSAQPDIESVADFMLHDFGMRGSKCAEAAGIAGAAHLLSFKGTDNLDALQFISEYYPLERNTPQGYSIPASEHSIAAMYGRDGELDYLRKMLHNYGVPNGVFACVGDTYSIYNFCRYIVPEILNDLYASGATLVIRPDSGDPVEVVREIFDILRAHGNKYKHFSNSKGFKVFKQIKIIQGDGVNIDTITQILEDMYQARISAENIVFGCGGYLLDLFNRDTYGFAMKTSHAVINGQSIDVIKAPCTDKKKHSRGGVLTLVKKDNQYRTIRKEELPAYEAHNFEPALQLVYANGIKYANLPNSWSAIR